jgi:hypothetical protein
MIFVNASIRLHDEYVISGKVTQMSLTRNVVTIPENESREPEPESPDEELYDMSSSIFSAFIEERFRSIEYNSHPEIIKFVKAVDDLDKYHVSVYNDCIKPKNDMRELVIKTVSQAKLCFPDIIPYNFFSPLFNRVNDSTLLDKHYWPIVDACLGYKITSTKQILLQFIRDTAMTSLRVKLESMEDKIPERMFESTYYVEVSAAKKLPLFSMNITNWNSIFFRPAQTPCCEELDKLRQVIENRYQRRVAAAKYFRS